MAQQLAFDWPQHVRMGADMFFVSEANAKAFAMVTNPDTWPDGKLVLTGPSGAGKTHLARVFADQSGAAILNAGRLDLTAPMPDTGMVLEDVPALPENAEEWVFHAHNHLRAQNLPLLLTGIDGPSRWPIKLPDLASRLRATTVIAIADPDDRLLDAVLMKLFQDRQIAPTPDALTFLRRHIDRSFQSARDAVEALDAAALSQGRAITRDLVRKVLDIPPRSG